MLNRVRAELSTAEKAGHEIFAIDECVFSTKKVRRAQWAPKRFAVQHQKRFYDLSYVSVMGAASADSGVFHYEMLENRAFYNEDVQDFL